MDSVDVCYVVPPVLSKGIPSFGVSILKSCLEQADFSCIVDYANYRFADAMGDDLRAIYSSGQFEPLVEYIFNGPAGINSGYTPAEAVDLYIDMSSEMGVLDAEERREPSRVEHMVAAVKKGCAVAPQETEETARRILAYKPKVVGCSSTFAQRNASLAILKRVKELDPDVITMLGGYNTTGAAGLATMRHFTFVDCVFFGESDDIVALAVSKLIAGDTQDMPYGVIVNSNELPDIAPHRIIEDLDSVPMPNFDEYVELFSSYQDTFKTDSEKPELRLPVEASRGCWWGEKSPCKFCGVCGISRTYRTKSPDKVVECLLALNKRYGVKGFDFADPIMPRSTANQLIDGIAHCGQDFDLAGMIKANIGREQLERMAAAGYSAILPGIEGLSDSFLREIGKGLQAMQGAALLKNATRLGVHVVWNLLFAAPQETDEQYEEQLALIPKVAHLEPPTGAFNILYARDSYYVNNSDEYGLDLVPLEATKLFCPQDEAYVRDVATYYRDVNATPLTPRRRELQRQLVEACAAWGKGYRRGRSRLDMADFDGKLMIFDSRPCHTSFLHTLQGLEQELYLLADNPMRRATLFQSLGRDYAESDIEEALQKLLDQNLMAEVSGQLIALALPMDRLEFTITYLLG